VILNLYKKEGFLLIRCLIKRLFLSRVDEEVFAAQKGVFNHKQKLVAK